MKWKPQRHYYIRVDFEAALKKKTKGGFEFIAPIDEGDEYQSRPFHGELIACPPNSRIPEGETVYVNFKAQEHLEKVDGEDVYIVTEDFIVGWGDIDNITPHKTIIIAPETEKITSDYLILPDYLFENDPTTKATVISSDNEWFESVGRDTFQSGDVIEYEKNLDWEFIVNREKHYYILWTKDTDWTKRIIKRNGELINGYNRVEEKDEWIDRNGIQIPNTDPFYKVLDGEFKGKTVYPEKKRIELNCFIKSEFIHGELVED